jgi:colanic acid biosynthesis glycosyl transferase WcaI
MKILVISQYFWPENFRVNELVTELGKRGHEVTVLTGLPNYPGGEVFEQYRNQPDAYRLYAGAEVVRVPLVPRGKTRTWLAVNYLSFAVNASLVGAWRLRHLKIDVIFVFEPSPIFVGIPSAFLRWLKGAPQVFWVLDLWPETLQAVGAIKSQRVLNWIGKLVRWIYARCDIVLAQSRSFIDGIQRYSSDRQRIEYFPAWAESVFDSAQAILAPEVPLAPDVFTVMFAGNIGDAQDFPAVLDAIEALRAREDIRWVIVGDGSKAEWLKHQINRRGLGERVCMPGRYSLDRMPSFFAHADALLVSLARQKIFSMTIPGKLQSYLAAGLPVVGMLDGEGADVIKRAGAGLVCDSGDGGSLSKIVTEMAAMGPAARQAMGASGRRFCHLEFDRNRQMDRLEGWLFELAGREIR